jgi:glycyl-tRNA synthetase alpha subunit
MITAISVFLFVCVLGYILTPLFQERMAWVGEVDDLDLQWNALQREKKIYLRALKDVEFEHASNKMNQADYDDLKSHYQQKVSEVIAEMDDLESEHEEPDSEG